MRCHWFSNAYIRTGTKADIKLVFLGYSKSKEHPFPSTLLSIGRHELYMIVLVTKLWTCMLTSDKQYFQIYGCGGLVEVVDSRNYMNARPMSKDVDS